MLQFLKKYLATFRVKTHNKDMKKIPLFMTFIVTLATSLLAREGVLECEPGLSLAKGNERYIPALPEKKFSVEVTNETENFQVEKIFSSEDFVDSPRFGGVISIRLYGDRVLDASEIMRMSVTVEHLSHSDLHSAKVYAEAVQVADFGSSLGFGLRSHHRQLYRAALHCNFQPKLVDE